MIDSILHYHFDNLSCSNCCIIALSGSEPLMRQSDSPVVDCGYNPVCKQYECKTGSSPYLLQEFVNARAPVCICKVPCIFIFVVSRILAHLTVLMYRQ